MDFMPIDVPLMNNFPVAEILSTSGRGDPDKRKEADRMFEQAMEQLKKIDDMIRRQARENKRSEREFLDRERKKDIEAGRKPGY